MGSREWGVARCLYPDRWASSSWRAMEAVPAVELLGAALGDAGGEGAVPTSGGGGGKHTKKTLQRQGHCSVRVTASSGHRCQAHHQETRFAGQLPLDAAHAPPLLHHATHDSVLSLRCVELGGGGGI